MCRSRFVAVHRAVLPKLDSEQSKERTLVTASMMLQEKIVGYTKSSFLARGPVLWWLLYLLHR